VSFQVDAGEAVGIIGPTGAGKSTLSQLLLRLREPSRGSYLVNGESAGSFTWTDWQSRVAYVPQEPRVLRGSVAENIRFFRDIEQPTIEEAARRANVHDEILAMGAAYDTVIGQRADAVSGGQRQRICLARALAGRPDLLVLDEPTSALDLASEAAVRASLAALRGQVTVFIIAHRLPLIDICQRVLVLDKGRVKAFADSRELDRHDAFYRRIVALGDRPDGTDTPNDAAASRRRPKTA
jgi:ABC-type multidrug transport system fused ATPase/permease subunit